MMTVLLEKNTPFGKSHLTGNVANGRLEGVTKTVTVALTTKPKNGIM